MWSRSKKVVLIYDRNRVGAGLVSALATLSTGVFDKVCAGLPGERAGADWRFFFRRDSCLL